MRPREEIKTETTNIGDDKECAFEVKEFQNSQKNIIRRAEVTGGSRMGRMTVKFCISSMRG